jgi:urate oxidase
MKTTASGFSGFIQDKYTDLQPVGAGSSNPDRIMCTEMTASWDHTPGVQVPDYTAVNTAVAQLLLDRFAGPAPKGVFSKSLQETVYRMATDTLAKFPTLAAVEIITPNVHFYPWEAGKFGLDNPNVVFRSTEPDTTASGRIYTKLTRANAKL